MSRTLNLCCLLFTPALLWLVIGCNDRQPDRGSLAFKQKQAEVYLDYLTQYPDSAGLRLIVANQLDSVGRYKEALAQMDTLIRTDSNKYAFWVVKAAIQLDSTDTTGTQQSLAKAIALFPGNEALLTQAEIYARQNNDTCLKIAATMTSSEVDKDYIAGLYAAGMLDSAKAIPLLNRCIDKDPQFAKAYVTLANLWIALGVQDNALREIQSGLRVVPDHVALLNLGGELYEKAGNKDSADILFKRSLSIHPYQPSIKGKLTSN